MEQEKTQEQIELEIKALEERKTKLESEAKQIAELRQEEEKNMATNVPKAEIAKKQEEGIVSQEGSQKVPETEQKQPTMPQKKEKPKDWDKFINISVTRHKVQEKDDKEAREEFKTGTKTYIDRIRLSINKYGNAVIQGRGNAIKRAVDIAIHGYLEKEGIRYTYIKLDKQEVLFKDRKKLWISEIKITVEKGDG